MKTTNIKNDTFLEQVFSIKNKDQYKVIRLFGISIQLNRTKLLKPYYNMPIQRNKIVFSNYKGNGYGCNPKYIAEEIIKRGLDYDLVWLSKNNVNTDDIPKQFRIVDFNSKQALKELITAKIWVDNYHKISMIKKGLEKREGQIYIQTWHGSLGIKKLEKQVSCLTENKDWENNAIKNSQMTDYWISNSEFETFVYKNSFWDVKNIKELGHPRNDIFFRDNERIIKKVRQFYDISDNKKIFLYVPTFRDDGDISWYDLDYQMLLNALIERFAGDWVLMIRHHPRIAKEQISLILHDNENIIDVTYYSDIQELLISADVVMSDYSSCIFDFMLTKRPAFIYATDIKKYNSERGFYYPLEATPFPIATNNKQLVQNIKNFDFKEYKQKVEIFLKEKGCIEDGKASERVVDLIQECIANE